MTREQVLRQAGDADMIAGWMRVCDVLDEVVPGWYENDNVPSEGLAAAAIRNLAAERERLQQSVCDFQAAAMLGVDPDGITPAHIEREITTLRSDLAALQATVDLLKGEVKAADDGSGITNVSEQYEAQLKAEREHSARLQAKLDGRVDNELHTRASAADPRDVAAMFGRDQRKWPHVMANQIADPSVPTRGGGTCPGQETAMGEKSLGELIDDYRRLHAYAIKQAGYVDDKVAHIIEVAQRAQATAILAEGKR